jgi:hypothetical protein
MRLLLLGATGLVGRTTLNQALAKDAISEVVAPTRRPLVPQNKLVNPVNLRLDELAPRVKSWDVDAVICALGTTKAKAGSQEAFRYVVEFPWVINNGLSVPLIFNKLHRPATLSRSRRQREPGLQVGGIHGIPEPPSCGDGANCDFAICQLDDAARFFEKGSVPTIRFRRNAGSVQLNVVLSFYSRKMQPIQSRAIILNTQRRRH